MPSYSFPVVSIPLYYVVAAIPHALAVKIAISGDARKYDNRNPKSTDHIGTIKAKLSAKEFARFERSENCHRNTLENMPLFVASVLASLYAERETGVKLDTSFYAALLLGVRVMYTLNYVTVETKSWSYVRSVLYNLGTVLCFTMLIRGAMALGDS